MQTYRTDLSQDEVVVSIEDVTPGKGIRINEENFPPYPTFPTTFFYLIPLIGHGLSMWETYQLKKQYSLTTNDSLSTQLRIRIVEVLDKREKINLARNLISATICLVIAVTKRFVWPLGAYVLTVFFGCLVIRNIFWLHHYARELGKLRLEAYNNLQIIR